MTAAASTCCRCPTVKVDNCVFESNAAGTKGGGLYAQSHANRASSDVRVLNTVFRSNAAATNGGGAFVGTTVTTTFSDVDFLENSAGGSTAALAHMGEHATGTAHSSACSSRGTPPAGTAGGARYRLYRTSGSVRFGLDVHVENTADESGGALGQDAQDGNEKDFVIESSTFTSNVAIAGGAVAFKQDTATIRGCAFTGNTANGRAFIQSYGGRGGALYKGNGARLDLTASTFLNNHAVRTDGQLRHAGPDGGGLIFATGSNGNPTQGAYVGDCTFEGIRRGHGRRRGRVARMWT